MEDYTQKHKEQGKVEDPGNEIALGIPKEEAEPKDVLPFPQDISIFRVLSTIINIDKKLDG